MVCKPLHLRVLCASISNSMITTLEVFETDEANEDIYEFVSSLFNLEEKTLLNDELFPLSRLENLNKTREKVSEQIYKESKEEPEKEETYKNAAQTISHNYLTRIIQDLLKIAPADLNPSEDLTNNILYLIQRKITYFDTINKNTKTLLNQEYLKELFNNNQEFNYTFLNDERNCSKKRDLIIKEVLKGNSRKYLNVFKEKLLSVSILVCKQILFLELQKLSYDEISKILTYLMHTNDCAYINLNNNQSKNAELFFQSNYWGKLLTKDQTHFYSSIQSIYNKLKNHDFSEEILTEHNKDLIETLLWLKSSPKDALQTLEILTNLYERDSAFAFDKPNNLILHLYALKREIAGLIGKTETYLVDKKTSDQILPDETLTAKAFCDSITKKVLNICQKILHEEELLVKTIIKTETSKRLRQIAQKSFYIISVILFLAILKFSHYYFFDIQSIYKNNYLKTAKSAIESTPYFIELKDSLDPVKNETNQKLRLDYINNLNARYFKVLTIFLSPDLSDEVIKNSLPSLIIPKNIKDINSIKIIRGSLSNMFSRNKWKTNIEPMLGPNVLTELRAYGAICNFLIPSLAHYVTLDKNGMIQISASSVKKDIIGTEPRYYIDKFDTNYKNIRHTSHILLSKIISLKTDTINKYKKTSSKEEKIKLKTILQGIAILEVRLNDLLDRIQSRHDFIVKHNTYRALID